MKLSITKSELQKGLSRIQAVVEKRSSMPILSNVLLETEKTKDGGKLVLSATDLEVGLRSEHDVELETPGGITVAARKLFEIVRELPDEKVELDTTTSQYLEIRCSRSRFSLAGTAAEEYPTLPGAEPKKTISIQSIVLNSMIERTMYATSLDETRYNLNGVLLQVLKEENKLRMVATDGHRLALVDRNIGSEASSLPSGVIIPRKALAELKRLVDEEDADELEVGFEENAGLVRKGRVTLMMRLIEGEFPNYEQVLPKSVNHRVLIPSDTLISAVRRVALLSTERTRAIKVEFVENRLRVSSSNPDMGEALEELDIDYAGENISIGFNARYLLDCLSALAAKELELCLADELSPARVQSTEDPDSFAVIMPMRL